MGFFCVRKVVYSLDRSTLTFFGNKFQLISHVYLPKSASKRLKRKNTVNLFCVSAHLSKWRHDRNCQSNVNQLSTWRHSSRCALTRNFVSLDFRRDFIWLQGVWRLVSVGIRRHNIKCNNPKKMSKLGTIPVIECVNKFQCIILEL